MSTRYSIIAFCDSAADAVQTALDGAGPDVKVGTAQAWLYHANWAIDWEKIPSYGIAVECEDGEITAYNCGVSKMALRAVFHEANMQQLANELKDIQQKYQKLLQEGPFDPSDDDSIDYYEEELKWAYRHLEHCREYGEFLTEHAKKLTSYKTMPQYAKRRLNQAIDTIQAVRDSYISD